MVIEEIKNNKDNIDMSVEDITTVIIGNAPRFLVKLLGHNTDKEISMKDKTNSKVKVSKYIISMFDENIKESLDKLAETKNRSIWEYRREKQQTKALVDNYNEAIDYLVNRCVLDVTELNKKAVLKDIIKSRRIHYNGEKR